MLNATARIVSPALGLLALACASMAQAQMLPLAPTVQDCGATTPGDPSPGVDPICTASTATPGLSCGFERGATGCTANDFVSSPTATSNNITACHIGDTITGVSLTVNLSSGSSSERQRVGLFIGEQDQDLSVANPGGDSCSVTTFPTSSTLTPARTPFPWNAATAGDVCGSYAKNFNSTEEIDNVTLKCEPAPDGNLALTFMIVYSQPGGSATCTGPTDVTAGASSKCAFGGTSVAGVPVQFNANPTCGSAANPDDHIVSVVYDPVANTITKTFTLKNDGPDSADGTTFDDPLPAPVTSVVGTPTCVASGGATCGTVTVNGSIDVKGGVTVFPSGSSVVITIVANVPPGNTGSYSNIVTLKQGPNVIVPAGWVTTCSGSTTLPVRLQEFEVK